MLLIPCAVGTGFHTMFVMDLAPANLALKFIGFAALVFRFHWIFSLRARCPWCGELTAMKARTAHSSRRRRQESGDQPWNYPKVQLEMFQSPRHKIKRSRLLMMMAPDLSFSVTVDEALFPPAAWSPERDGMLPACNTLAKR